MNQSTYQKASASRDTEQMKGSKGWCDITEPDVASDRLMLNRRGWHNVTVWHLNGRHDKRGVYLKTSDCKDSHIMHVSRTMSVNDTRMWRNIGCIPGEVSRWFCGGFNIHPQSKCRICTVPQTILPPLCSAAAALSRCKSWSVRGRLISLGRKHFTSLWFVWEQAVRKVLNWLGALIAQQWWTAHPHCLCKEWRTKGFCPNQFYSLNNQLHCSTALLPACPVHKNKIMRQYNWQSRCSMPLLFYVFPKWKLTK